jgi:anthranilate synthase component 1
MSIPDLPPGHLLPLARRLSARPEPLTLFGALTEQGCQADTLLLESADSATGEGERSLLIPRAALRVACRGAEVRVVPLTPNGVGLAAWLASISDAAVWEGRTLVLTYPIPAGRDAPDAERIRDRSPLDALRMLALGPTVTAHPTALTHLVAGVFAYDLIDLFETLPPAANDPLDFPDYLFWVPEQLLVVDHVRGSVAVVALVVGGPGAEGRYHDAVRSVNDLVAAVTAVQPSSPRQPCVADDALPQSEIDLDDGGYADVVRRLKSHVERGDVFQIVPSRRFTVPCPDPFAAYRELRDLNPSPYMFYLRAPDHTLFGASPETAVRVRGQPPEVAIRPIAGTMPRGRGSDGALDLDYDARLEAALRTDAKELAEHMMLVDLARNDVARVSRPGTRRVSRMLSVDRYSYVMHLVSEVTGALAPDLDALHAYAASLNMGTLVGAPKIRAAQLLRGVERGRRGPYGGAVGYLTGAGEMDTAIVIRAAYVRDGVAHVRAGAGVVMASDPVREAQETRYKAASVLRAIARASERSLAEAVP